MGYLIATRYCALRTVTLITDDQRRSFNEFCDDKFDEINGDPRELNVDYSTYYASPEGKRLFIEFRKDWDKTNLDRLFENGAYPECTLVTIVPDTAAVPSSVLEKMDAYKAMESQKPTKQTVALEDFELIEVFRRRAESIRDAHPNKMSPEPVPTGRESKTKKSKPLGSGQQKIYEKRLPSLFEDIERQVYSEQDPLHPATAYRYTKNYFAEQLKQKYPNEFKGRVGSVAKQIQMQPSWEKWKETREKFIGKDHDLDQSTIRVERFESVVHDFLASILGLKDRVRDKKYGGIYDKECDGMSDEEYLKFANRITTKMVAQWAKQHEIDYVEIGEVFRWSINSLAVEFAKTSEWKNRKETLGVTHRVSPRRRG